METDVRRNETESRYELDVDGELVGIAEYVETDRVVVFPHTVIDPEHQGQGLGAVLVQAALDDVRRSGRSVVASCWYVDQFITENRDYQDLLAS